METFESVVKQKTDSELVDIYINSHDYQESFLICVENELINRKIPTSAITKVRHPEKEISDEKLRLGEQKNPIWMILCFVMAIFGVKMTIYGVIFIIEYFSQMDVLVAIIKAIVLLIIGFSAVLIAFFSLWVSNLYTKSKIFAKEINAVRYLKKFLGLNFKDQYHVIEFKKESLNIVHYTTYLGDYIFSITVSLPDETFKKITTFLKTVKLGIETTYNKEKTIKNTIGWKKNKEENIYIKIHKSFSTPKDIDFPYAFTKEYEDDEGFILDFSEELAVDCDKKILFFSVIGDDIFKMEKDERIKINIKYDGKRLPFFIFRKKHLGRNFKIYIFAQIKNKRELFKI